MHGGGTRTVGVVLGVLSVLTLALAVAHAADPAVVHTCVNASSGTVRIVTASAACRTNEVPLDWPAAAAGGGLRVVDSTGQVLGALVLTNQVPIKVGDVTLLFSVKPSGFAGAGVFGPSFLYENPDCTGTQYLPAYPNDSFFQTVYQVNGLGYYPTEPWEVRALYSNSFFGCSPTSALAGVVGTIDLPTLGFVPPFHVE